jgi:hypothetical protein
MTTATAPRTIATTSGNYAMIADTTVRVVAGSHDDDGKRSATVHAFDNIVGLSASDEVRHATFYMSRDEARMFAQAILDATA